MSNGLVRLPHPHVEVAGALDLEHTADGVIPRRLPAWTWPQVPPDMHRGVRGSSGVRLRLWPSGDRVVLRLRCAIYHPESAPPQRIDTVRGDAVVATLLPGVSVLPETGLPHPDAPFDDVVIALPPGDGPVELWLPPGGVTEVAGVAADGLRPLPDDRRLFWWHYGSSISQCTGAAGPSETWPAIVSRTTGAHLTSLGFGGEAMLDPFVARTLRESDADRISVEVGINIQNGATMTARTFAPALHGFLDTIREGHPEVPVLVVSPILFPDGEDCPGPLAFTPDGRAIPQGDPASIASGALSVGAIRRLIDAVLSVRRDDHLTFWDGRDLIGQADVGRLPDGLHPDAAGYRLLGRLFAARALAEGFLG